jgi:hypothetical protein
MKHHLDLRIILLSETNGTLVAHDPRRIHPKSDVHGFVFTVIVVAALIVVVVVVATLTVTAALSVVL